MEGGGTGWLVAASLFVWVSGSAAGRGPRRRTGLTLWWVGGGVGCIGGWGGWLRERELEGIERGGAGLGEELSRGESNSPPSLPSHQFLDAEVRHPPTPSPPAHPRQ